MKKAEVSFVSCTIHQNIDPIRFFCDINVTMGSSSKVVCNRTIDVFSSKPKLSGCNPIIFWRTRAAVCIVAKTIHTQEAALSQKFLTLCGPFIAANVYDSPLMVATCAKEIKLITNGEIALAFYN